MLVPFISRQQLYWRGHVKVGQGGQVEEWTTHIGMLMCVIYVGSIDSLWTQGSTFCTPSEAANTTLFNKTVVCELVLVLMHVKVFISLLVLQRST